MDGLTHRVCAGVRSSGSKDFKVRALDPGYRRPQLALHGPNIALLGEAVEVRAIVFDDEDDRQILLFDEGQHGCRSCIASTKTRTRDTGVATGPILEPRRNRVE